MLPLGETDREPGLCERFVALTSSLILSQRILAEAQQPPEKRDRRALNDWLLPRITGRRYKTAEFPFKKCSKSDRRAILQIRSDDLDPDWKTGR
jgi:hypothetical protein